MRPKFPVGLTVAAAFALAVLVGLGAWQLWWRLPQKLDTIARIARLEHEAPRPLADVLAEGARGADVSFTRVETSCLPTGPAPSIYRYALRQGQVGWRLMGACHLAGGTSIALDRGLADRFAGGMAPAAATYSAPSGVVGVLRKPGARSFLTPAPARAADGSVSLLAIDTSALELIAGPAAAPYYLAVEKETPAPPGVTPAALPEDIPNNHFVYALTWFGLAGVLIWMWAAFVVRRMRAR